MSPPVPGQPRPLYPDQVVALDLLRSSLLAGHSSPLLQAPTGFGKTNIAASIVSGLLARRKRVAFVVSRLGLIDQTFSRFMENGISADAIGVVQADHPWCRPSAPVQVCSIQTVARREWPDVDAVIIDEAHELHEGHKAWMTSTLGRPIVPQAAKQEGVRYLGSQEHQIAARKLPRPFFVGLTATPWAKGLGQWFDCLLRPTSLSALIEAKRLSPFRVFAPASPDLTGVKTVAGDYHQGQLAERMGHKTITGNIVETWLARGEGRPTLCFCVNRAHAAQVAERFRAVGVPTAYVDCDTPREEREEIGKDFHAGHYKIVCNIGTLTTGIDWDVRCIILARPTRSEMLFVQMIGRGLRVADGKTDCLILDHSDTHLQLGMVTDIDHDELDDGTKRGAKGKEDRERKEPAPWRCPACTALVPARIDTCCECGCVRKRPVNVSQRAGELSELKLGGKRGPTPSEHGPVADSLVAMGKGPVYAQLLGFARERRRSDGWAAHKYRELFGVWPRGHDREVTDDPSPLLRSWIKSRDIAWARSQPSRRETEADHA